MTGTAAKAITDEMVSPRLADALRMRGYDVSSCQSEGRADRSFAEMIRRLQIHLSTVDAETQRSRIWVLRA